jgi:hypothetical protein
MHYVEESPPQLVTAGCHREEDVISNAECDSRIVPRINIQGTSLPLQTRARHMLPAKGPSVVLKDDGTPGNLQSGSLVNIAPTSHASPAEAPVSVEQLDKHPHDSSSHSS